MKKYNGCIFLISARKNLLHLCLKNLNDNYNKKFNYPILIFYHGEKYDDISYQKSIKEINKNTEINFYKLESKIPNNINEKDLFYNKEDIEYVKKSFSKNRIGYLHMINWKIKFITNKELQKFDYFL